ncbi:hypothetical protein Ae406Ps2_5996c [Pseudonocardia sp. Ae406_Ps2]|nr:hypothetical protein Ae331Ps2_5961 [Pseudonocardia sp. Ae331_Ps2]OLL96162.1 hypothetical protein Ae406Ps2_5996c [Pseudonocardia sp. Ae406_Ps2]OLM08690.1 hypothetical protein Ae505Ps2_6077c [Pseudonocardia sp. Ae505_Ps2]OLM09545.1 hypothetical protein Ae706Ps2_6007 [Pseudonocardia sp. Ae706_Ps2]
MARRRCPRFVGRGYGFRELCRWTVDGWTLRFVAAL